MEGPREGTVRLSADFSWAAWACNLSPSCLACRFSCNLQLVHDMYIQQAPTKLEILVLVLRNLEVGPCHYAACIM